MTRLILVIGLLTGCHKLFGLEYVESVDANASASDDSNDGNGSNSGDGGNLGDGGAGGDGLPADSYLDLIKSMAPLHVCVGGTATIRVSLNYYPGSSITVEAYPSDFTKISVSPASRVFTSTDWNVWQDFVVTGIALSPLTSVLLGVPNYRAVTVMLPVDC